ncbi:TorF family putative porin [Acanthopleuribacter pedis]|uniref:Uncharacterized protein n=1 Tax=Acanthopleuribacter pedis TaxID=442870 RepID=A0A8J7QDA6_9BACT|nr:TorF family putative porin [Acanthopleuribacter pedis]MBO1322422.1 hypothetical protein [Acanthopleuribacter pedis]
MNVTWKSPTIFLVALLSFPLLGFGEFSANLGVTPDYVWRGESQTDEEPALQGGLDYAFTNGLYVGTWASNVKFGDERDVEIDLYGGFGTEFESGLSLDVGHISYVFPDGDDVDEAYLGLGFKIFEAKYYYDYDNENSYLDGSLSFDLPKGFGLGLHAGLFDFDQGEDRNDYKLAVSKSMWSLDFELGYTDTDWDSNIHDGRVTFLISKTW